MLKIVIDSIRAEMKTNTEAQGKILHGGLKGIRHYVDSNAEITQAKIQTVIEQNIAQNGSIETNGKDIDILKEQIKPVTNIRKKLKKPITYAILFIVIGIGLGLYEIVYHEVGLYKAFLFIKKLLS